MRKIGLSLALAALLLVCMVAPAMASANEAWIALVDKTVDSIDRLTAATGQLTVIGTAAIAVEPDTASVTLGVLLEHASTHEAQRQVNDVMAKVIETVKALGIQESKIATSAYSVNPAYDYTQDPPALRGYQVSNTVTVQVEQFDLISQVIDAAVAAGANQVQGISFNTSKRGEIYRQALQSAIAAAQGKATVAAGAAGKQLGALRSLTEAEQGVSAYLNAYDSRVVGLDKSGAQILGGEINVTAQVTLVYEMK
jgi:uncharacterized protein YggE